MIKNIVILIVLILIGYYGYNYYNGNMADSMTSEEVSSEMSSEDNSEAAAEQKKNGQYFGIVIIGLFLKNFNCFSVDFTNFPKTIYICGSGDMVVDHLQYKLFLKQIKDFELQIMFTCGHAPHFSHQNDFLNIINEKI